MDIFYIKLADFFSSTETFIPQPKLYESGTETQNSLGEARKTDASMHTAQSHYLSFLKKEDSKYCPDRYDRPTLGPTSDLGQQL